MVLGCEYNFPDPVPADSFDPGSADFSKMVVLGDELGAGLKDGALYTEAQENSIGKLLSNQISQNNSSHVVFNQPDIESELGYNLMESGSETRGKSFLKFVAPGESQIFKDTNPGELPAVYSGPGLNNFSVPFLRTPEVLDPSLSNNPYYQRFASDPGTSLLIDEVIASSPTMSIIQLGWYDILAFAKGGLTGDVNPSPGSVGPTDLTPLELFEDSYGEIISRLIDNTEGEVILINIPDISKFPFFRSIGTRAFINGQEVGFLANFYREYNIQVSRSNKDQPILRPTIQFFSDDPPHLWFAVVDDPALVDRVQEDGSPLPKWRQMEEGEYISWGVPMLPSMESDGLGTTLPIDKSLFFTPSDHEVIGDLVDQYNQVISDIALSNPRIYLFDWYSIAQAWAESGVTFDGVLHTYDFNQSGIFSSDGTSLNARGSALFTNQLAQFINQTFESNIPPTNPNSFPGNNFVNDF
jgi:hypothetical protein